MISPNPKFSALQQAAYQLSSCTDQIFQRIEQEQILDGIVERIRSSFELEDIFKTTSTSIRQLLNAHRVAVFRFTPGSGFNEGEFISEDVVAGFPSAMEAKIHDHCFGTQYAVYYAQGRVQSVADIYDAGMSDCHISILEKFQVRANLIVPVIKGEELWGILCIHQCAQPRRWQLPEIEFVKKIASHLSIALQQADYLEKLKNQATLLAKKTAQEKAFNRQKALVKIVSKIRQSFEFSEICQTTCEEVRLLLEAERITVYRFNDDWSGDFLFESVAEGWNPLVGVSPTIEDTYLKENQGGRYKNNQTFAISDIYTAGHEDCHVKLLEEFQARAYMIAPIFQGNRLWGLLNAFQNSATRNWQTDEVELLAQVGEQLGIALKQANEQIKAFNRQKALVKIVSKIRQSFEFSQICQTTCEQVRLLLEADRITIFRFNNDWSGDFLFESVAESWNPLVGVSPTIEDTYLKENQGGRYKNNQTLAISDIYTAGHEDCHVKLLEEFQARAYIIAPIFQGNRLWGLLNAFQNSAPRNWQTDEVELLAQVGEQLGIALKQTEFVEQIQSQTKELKQSQLELQGKNQELARATRLKDEFLANMSHELRTPLNSILGMTEALQEGIFGEINNSQLTNLQTIESSGLHLLELINEILDLAKIESGQMQLELSYVAIPYLCQSSLNFVKQQCYNKNIQLHQKIPQNLPEIIIDELRIRQSLINLLNNAVKFTPEGGEITLEVVNLLPDETHSQNYLRFAVKDTGIGIDSENLTKLFQPFIQIDSALNRQYEGTGLGLALVKRIVESHGGKVGVTSEVGVGSCFTVELPYSTFASNSAISTNTSKSNSKTPQTEQPTATITLIAEDSEASINTITNYLKAKGYSIQVAKNVQVAIELAQTQMPNIILIDIEMPLMDGLSAISHIRQLPALAQIPIIALSALAMKEAPESFLAAGANIYHHKPVNLKQLALSIQKLLSSYF